MDPVQLAQIAAAASAFIASLSALAVGVSENRRPTRQRAAAREYAELAQQFEPGSYTSRALRVAARNAACDAVAHELTPGRFTSMVMTVFMSTTGLLIAGVGLAASVGTFDDLMGVGASRLTGWVAIVGGFAIFATMLRIWKIMKYPAAAVRDGLVRDGWYLDLADTETLIVNVGNEAIGYRERPAAPALVSEQASRSSFVGVARSFFRRLPSSSASNWLVVPRLEHSAQARAAATPAEEHA
jgi:hypothetical protein